MTQEYTAPRIYAACLAAYNDGRLHGRWIDCEGKSAGELQNAINDVLADSPCPNVMRRKCEHCGTYQTDSRPYRENESDCGECGEPLPDGFKPSAEEWAIHDHEGFAGLISSEWPDLADVATAADILADDDQERRRGLLYLVNDCGYSISDAADKCEEVQTSDESPEGYAASFVEECYSDALEALPDFLRYAIDYERVARDFQLGGDVCETTQGGERFLVTNASSI